MDTLLLIPLISGFVITLLLIPFWMKKASQLGLVWEDMNKLNSKKVVGSAGFMAVVGFLFASLIFISYRTFLLKHDTFLIEIFATLLLISFLAGIGIIDDLFGWQKGGLSRRSRIILVLFSSVPLVVINAGRHVVSLPFFSLVNLGIIYPLILIPLGIVAVTTTFNFLAGFNGLEAGQGVLLLSASAIVAFYTGNSWISVLCLAMVFPLLAFLLFNFYPAKVFPGNSITYAIGGLFAASCILGNYEKIAFFFFIPYIIETVLKSRGKLIKHSFGKPNSDGSLSLRYEKLYGLTHVSIFLFNKMGIKPTEKRVVLLIWAFQLIIIGLGILIFRRGIFY